MSEISLGKKTLLVTLSPQLYEKMREFHDLSLMSFSDIIRAALLEYLERHQEVQDV